MLATKTPQELIPRKVVWKRRSSEKMVLISKIWSFTQSYPYNPMGLIYLPRWMVDFYGIIRYIYIYNRPMDPGWFFVSPSSSNIFVVSVVFLRSRKSRFAAVPMCPQTFHQLRLTHSRGFRDSVQKDSAHLSTREVVWPRSWKYEFSVWWLG